MSNTYEPNVGMECHAELLTRSKMFCGCANDFGGAPNTRTCPVCLGLPGSLPVPNANLPADTGATDRRKLRSKLGMSTSSSYDMRSEFVSAGKAKDLFAVPPPRSPDDRRESFHSALTTQDDMDALMSPRATEFTRNPFADALGLGVKDEPQQSSVVGTTEDEIDPRSPVQKAGTSPIIRNIADAFSSQ